MCALKNSHIAPHMSFAPEKCVNFSDFDTVSIWGVHCLSFAGCSDDGQMTITHSSFFL